MKRWTRAEYSGMKNTFQVKFEKKTVTDFMMK